MKSIILHITNEDMPYLPVVKPLLAGRATVRIDNTIPSVAYELVMKAKQHNATIVSTSVVLLKLVTPDASNQKISDYAGSFIEYRDAWFLFIDPLANLVTTNIGKFVFKRFLDKVLHPENWIVEPPFRWELFQPSRLEKLYTFFDGCNILAVDIETRVGDPNRVIVCCSITGLQLINGKLAMMTVVVPLNEEYNLLFLRLVLSNPVPKVFQNGKYDIAYLLRYNIPVTAYTFDTINLFHSWLCELPKDLGFISAFMIRTYSFHKNDGKTGDILDYYQYNAKDTYTTALCCLALLLEMPEYADKNFLIEFPVVFPCILSEMTGIKWDDKRAKELEERVDREIESDLGSLRTMVACSNYNPNSSQQTVRLFAMLGSPDVKSTTPPEKEKVSIRHPLNEIIIKKIISVREKRKLQSSYFKESGPWLGRMFYALNPHGTDTGRLAAKTSQYWCGIPIHGIPSDNTDDDISVKEAFIADDGFFFGEADYAQAEARDVAYLSGDTNLIAAVDDDSKDFHGLNASSFFGIPYDQIVKSSFNEELDEWLHKVVNKVIRQLSKRTNHGANYNMGPGILLQTMGTKNVILAKLALKLPASWPLIKVTEYLLRRYDETYPVVRDKEGGYYGAIIRSVNSTGILIGPTGWARRCFGSPSKNKLDLNSLVAHPSQSLNAMTLSKAYRKVFYNIYLPNPQDFRLCVQIHDSILFQYRKGREDLAYQVAKEMDIPTPVTDIFGITRTLRVPVDLKGNASRWSEVEAMRIPKEEIKPLEKKVA